MADDKKMKFDDLPADAQEALTPRGKYLNPEMLDKGTSLYEGAPSGPVADDKEPDGSKAETEEASEPDKPKRAKSRTT